MSTGKGNHEIGPEVVKHAKPDDSHQQKMALEGWSANLNPKERTTGTDASLLAGLDPATALDNFSKRVAPLAASLKQVSDPVLGTWDDIVKTLKNPKAEKDADLALAEATNLKRLQELV